MSRLQIALGIYVLLGVLAWLTLPDPRFRYLTIAFLAFFAFRTWTTSMRGRLKDEEEQKREQDPDE